ncbi:MAG: HEPN domain-containing protein [Solirubrobacterales bacterium]
MAKMMATMQRDKRPYLEADGVELDCAYFVSDDEFVSGFLRLPSPSETGRVRFLEEIGTFLEARGTSLLDPIPLTVRDGKGGGIEACLLGAFVTSTRFSSPLPPQFPISLAVNRVLIGSSDAERSYESASLRCAELLAFLGVPSPAPERAVELGTHGIERAKAQTNAVSVGLREGVEVDHRKTAELALRWYGEITLAGPPRPLEAWAKALVEHLCLFAFLCDQPLRPGQIYSEAYSERADFYASWHEAGAPSRTEPLLLLPEVGDRFEEMIVAWNGLLDDAHDFIDHVIDFQLYREHRTLTDQVLSLSRSLELYFDYATRFDSKYRPTLEHRVLVDEAIEQMSLEFRERHGSWMHAALLASNQKRLVAQLESILEDLGPKVCAACGISEPSRFAAIAKDARNHYTHPTGSPKASVPEGRDLVIHVNRLWFVARGCVLLELGLERDEVADVLNESARRYLLG